MSFETTLRVNDPRSKVQPVNRKISIIEELLQGEKQFVHFEIK